MSALKTRRSGGGERANLEVNGHEAAQAAMIEQQVEPIVVVVNPQGELPGHETEIAAEFGEELLEVGEDGGFKVLLGIRALEAEEVEQVRVFEGILVADCFDGAARCFSRRTRALVSRERATRSNKARSIWRWSSRFDQRCCAACSK
jgi:hypothetical protein